MNQTQGYASPPIVEAVLQLQFSAPLDPWSIATPGRVYERVASTYPNEPELQQEVQAKVQPGTAAANEATVEVNQGRQRILFKSSDGHRVLILGRDHLAVSSLEPYEGWKAFLQRLRQARADIGSMLNFPKVSQISAKYINRILVPAIPIETSDYFRISLETANDGKAKLAGFVNRVESILDERTRLIRTFASLESPPSSCSFLLDIEAIESHREGITEAEAFGRLGHLRKIKNEEFEASITDKTRQLFS